MTSQATDMSDYVPGEDGPLLDANGVPIDKEYMERAAREAEEGFDLATASRVGRLSLSEGAQHSPRVSFRVSDDIRSRAELAAQREGKTVSQIAREALERYLAS